MLSFKRFQPIILQVFILSLLLLGRHGEITAARNPSPEVSVESAGWLLQGEMYGLSGTMTRPESVSVSQIEMSFTAIALSNGESWELFGDVTWESESQCTSTPPLLCDEWFVSLDVLALPIDDYNLEVSGEFDPNGQATDTFGDDPDERCGFNCPNEGMPDCNAGLCQHGTIIPEVRFIPALPGLYAVAPRLEAS